MENKEIPIENNTDEVASKKRKLPYKKRISKLRTKSCEEYDVFLRLIDLTGEQMMFLQHFIYLAVLFGYSTEAKMHNEILPDMKRMGLVKVTDMGSTRAKFIMLKKTAVRHVKGLDSSERTSATKANSSDYPKILNLMKMDYLICHVIPEILEKYDWFYSDYKDYKKGEVKLTIERVKDYLNYFYSTLLLKQKDEIAYYWRLKNDEDAVNKAEINEIRRYSFYNSARQKSALGLALSENEEKAIAYHKNYYQTGVANPNSGYYEKIALIKNPHERSVIGLGGITNKPKKKQAFEDKITEYERLPHDPRLLITHFQKQNVFIRNIIFEDVNTVDVVILNTKRSISTDYFKNLVFSICNSLNPIVGRNFNLNITICFFNEESVIAFERMRYNSKVEEKLNNSPKNSTSANITIKLIDMEIADEYLMTTSA